MLPVRTIPPYVRSVEDDDDDYFDTITYPEETASTNDIRGGRSNNNNSARPSARQYLPGRRRPSEPARGRKHDSKRTREPAIISTPFSEYGSRWISFASPTTGGPPRKRVTEEEATIARQLLSTYDREKDDDQMYGKVLRRPKMTILEQMHDILLLKPAMPLIFRLFVLIMSVAALGIAVSVYQRLHFGCRQGSSTYMAIIVDSLAIIYTLYIAVDEFKSPPIGVRPAGAKFGLTLLDLFFIVFDAANLSIAFEALTDKRWACHDDGEDYVGPRRCPKQPDVCARQQALTAVLLVALVAWLATFVVSLYRLVGKIGLFEKS